MGSEYGHTRKSNHSEYGQTTIPNVDTKFDSKPRAVELGVGGLYDICECDEEEEEDDEDEDCNDGEKTKDLENSKSNSTTGD